jgi:hypothetical protein
MTRRILLAHGLSVSPIESGIHVISSAQRLTLAPGQHMTLIPAQHVGIVHRDRITLIPAYHAAAHVIPIH